MLDISSCEREISTYGGSEVKMTFYINNKKYMVKFPDPVCEKNKNFSYINNQYSEYVGCKIFELLGIDTQKVELVTCEINGRKKVAVACQDFLKEDETLIEFKNISYSLNPEKKYTSSIEDIYEMISLFKVDKKDVIQEFWRRFIIDTILGNSDRHLGNWGFVKSNNSYHLAPVYDGGSTLNPLLTEEKMKELLKDEIELKNVSYNVKTAYMMDHKKVSYRDYLEICQKI